MSVMEELRAKRKRAWQPKARPMTVEEACEEYEDNAAQIARLQARNEEIRAGLAELDIAMGAA